MSEFYFKKNAAEVSIVNTSDELKQLNYIITQLGINVRDLSERVQIEKMILVQNQAMRFQTSNNK